MVFKNINVVFIKMWMFFDILLNILYFIIMACIKATHLETELMDLRVSH